MAAKMKNRTNRTNRATLALIGVILLLIGAGAILLGQGVFGTRYEHEGVIDKPTVDFFHRYDSWLWWVIGAVALVIALLALYWLVVQLRIERVTTLTLERTRAGSSTLSSSALTDAVSDEAELVSGVARARTRLLDSALDPQLMLRVWLRDDADLTAVRDDIEHRVLADARSAMNVDRMRTYLRLELESGGHDRSRVQ